MIIQSVLKYITDIDDVKGLGVPSIFLVGESPDDVRNNAKQRLIRGEIRFIFVVDICNEGVDISEINTDFFFVLPNR